MFLFFVTLRVISCVFVPHRSDNFIRVHGGSSKGWMGHEHAQVGFQRHRLGHPEQWEVTMTCSLSGFTAHILFEADTELLSSYLWFRSLACISMLSFLCFEAGLQSTFSRLQFSCGFDGWSRVLSLCCTSVVVSELMSLSETTKYPKRRCVVKDSIVTYYLFVFIITACIFSFEMMTQ